MKQESSRERAKPLPVNTVRYSVKLNETSEKWPNQTFNAVVAGSSPARLTILSLLLATAVFAFVIQRARGGPVVVLKTVQTRTTERQ